MKTSILVFSQTGNTMKVGEAIAQGLKTSGSEVEQVRFLRRTKWKPESADLIGVGCPVFENRPAEVIPDFLAEKGFDFRGKKAFVFVTSGGSPARSLWHLGNMVRATGAEVLGGIQVRGCSSMPTLFGLFPDRPHAVDLEQAGAFGTALAENLLNGAALPVQYGLSSSRGGHFYDRLGPVLQLLKKKTTPLPVCDPAKCDLCGNCIYDCPTKSITVNGKSVAFHKTCIVCYRCWLVCPHDAISIKFSPGNGLLERWLYSEKMERRFGNIEPGEHVGENLFKDVLARRIKLKYDRKNPTADYEYKSG